MISFILKVGVVSIMTAIMLDVKITPLDGVLFLIAFFGWLLIEVTSDQN